MYCYFSRHPMSDSKQYATIQKPASAIILYALHLMALHLHAWPGFGSGCSVLLPTITCTDLCVVFSARRMIWRLLPSALFTVRVIRKKVASVDRAEADLGTCEKFISSPVRRIVISPVSHAFVTPLFADWLPPNRRKRFTESFLSHHCSGSFDPEGN